MTRRRLWAAVAAVLGIGLVAGGCFLFPNRPPEAAFVVLYGVDPEDPLVVDLDATLSVDPDGDAIVAYQWVFGEDVTLIAPEAYTQLVNTPTLRVRYPFEGTYQVTLAVRDERGADSQPVSQTLTLPNIPVEPTE